MPSQASQNPPRLALWLLERVVWSDDYEYASGDFAEMYADRLRLKGAFRAGLWCGLEVIRSLPGFINNSLFWGAAMFRNYLKVALRNIARHKGFSFINIAGLSIGVACCLVISLWVYYLLSFDRFHEKSDRLYQVLAQGDFVKDNPSTPAPLAAALKNDVADIIRATRFESTGEKLVSKGEMSFYEDVYGMDADFFEMFSFEFVQGDPARALDDLHSVVLVEATARKYFVTVTAVVKHPPDNSSLRFHMAVPFAIKEIEMREQTGQEMGWGWYSPNTFVEVGENADADELGTRIEHFMAKYEGEDCAGLSLLPLSERLVFFTQAYTQIYVFSAIGLFVLLIASINFVNLSTARSANRSREVGMRKAVGALRRNIFNQFLGETTVMALLAVALAVVIVAAVLPTFSGDIGIQLYLGMVPPIALAVALAGLVVLLGLMAGIYPALVASAFRPIQALTSDMGSGRRGSWLRKALVFLQFAISAVLIIGTVVVYQQVAFAESADTGYDRDHLIKVRLTGDSQRLYTKLKDDLLADPHIVQAAGSGVAFPYLNWSTGAVEWDRKAPDDDIHVYFNSVDYGFVETMGLPVVEGRALSPDIASDASGVMINETMARRLGLESPVGSRIKAWDNDLEIIGVLKDFHFQPMTESIEPIMFVLDQVRLWQLTIRVAPDDVDGALAAIRQTWERNLSSYPFQYSFVSDDLEGAYLGTAQMGKLAGFFAALALFVACLGSLGLASRAAQVRAKEIAIRKVLGASARSTVLLLSRELGWCVLAANLIAWPIGYLIMDRWLQNYSYRISLGVDVFALTLLVTCLAAALAVGHQAIRAARTNPVERLKYE